MPSPLKLLIFALALGSSALPAAAATSPTVSPAVKARAAATCAAAPITPYISVNSGSWQPVNAVTVPYGADVYLAPWPLGGTWSWTGPNGFTSTANAINGIPLTVGANVYNATYTDANGCTSSEGFTITETGPVSGFNLASASPTLSVPVSGSATDTITVTEAAGFSGAVTLAASGLPAGVTATFGTNPATGTSVITFSANSAAKAGTSTVTITGTSGTLTATTTVALTVATTCAATPITPYISVAGGAWQEINAVTVAPGTDVYLGPWPLGGTWSWTGPNGFTSTANAINDIPLSVGANVFNATYTDANHCTSSESFTITETSGSSSFTLSPSASSVTVAPGASAADTITVAPANGFSGAVTLAVSGLPSGVTGAFGTNPTTGSSVLTLTAGSAAASSAATVTVTGTSGTLTASTSFMLNVGGGGATGLVSVLSSASSVSITQGTSGFSNITLAGFSGTPTLTATGVPNGVTATFSANPNGGTLLTLAAAAGAPVSSGTVTVTGVSGGQSAATSFAVSIVAAPAAQTTCNGGATIGIDANYYVYEQNEWNSSEQQCASVVGDNVTMTAANFNLPTNGSPADYASVIYGCHSGGPCSTGGNLPIQVSALTAANTSVSFVQPAGYSNNDAYDIWFDQQPSAGSLPNGTELMIWPNHQGSIQPYGSPVGSVTINGVYYQVWTGFEEQWNVITFLQAPTVNFVNNLDLMPFIQYAETQTVNGAQVLKPSWYLVDMEFGFEIWDGGQGLALNNFSAFATSAPVTPVPAIASLSPAIAGPGASVTLNGSNFGAAQGSSAVRFGNTPAAITSWSNTAITAIVPSISLGQTNVAVTVNSQTSTPVGFTVGSTAAAVSAAAGAVTVSQAGSATDAITVSGFTGNVTLAVSGLPSGVTGSFGANPTPGSSVLTLTASSTAALGSYKVTVTGTSGSATASTTLTLTVGAPVAPGFTLAPSSPALSIAAGLAGTETVAFTASGGFTGAVTYAVTGLPAGVTAVFGTNPVHGAIASENGVSTSNAFTGSTVLALFTKSTTAPATATVTVTGSSGTLTASTTFTLAVTAEANAPSGYWHTSGNQILDANNKPVRMASINWYGLEQQVAVPSGLLVQDYHTILQTMVDLGYNTIRIPFSNQVVETPAVPQSLWTASINQDLAGLNSMQILDRVVATAGALGLHVILDNHRSDAGNSAEENGLWYTAAYPESSWIADWKAMAARYAGSNTVIGMDLRDEPHAAETGGSCWGCGTTTNDWRLAAERAGNAIQAVNPNLLIFVEGNDCFNGDCDFWGGNLEGVASYPVVLNTANHLVYSPHDYGPNLYGQPWFNSSTTPSSLQATWNKYWGYIFQNKTAPLWIGEFGTTNASADIQSSVAGSQGQWFQSLVAYLQANPSIGWGYWAINGEDTYALLDANYDPTPVSTVKQSMLASIEPAGGAAAAPSFTLGVSAGAVSVSQAGNATDTITIAGLNGFNGAVTLGVSGLPAGVTAAFATNPATASSVLTLTASSSAAVGTATVTVTGTSGSLSATTTMALTVSGKVAPSFTLSAAAATATLVQAATTTDTIAINAQGGFSGAVTLSASGLPAGVTAGFGSNPATGTSVLTFSASSTAAAGTYTITVNGTSGAMTASTTISLVVQAAGAGFACHVVYTVPTSWAGGFTAALTLYNTGTTAISNWNLTWTYANGQTITSIWNAGVAQSGANVTLSNLAFNGTIPAGGSYANIGFNGTWNNATNAVPASFSINGVLCK